MQNSDNVFEGKPDDRQSSDAQMVVSRFRPRYRALAPGEKALHDQIKDKAAELEALFNQIDLKSDPASKAQASYYHQYATKDLESAVMWAIKELTL